MIIGDRDPLKPFIARAVELLEENWQLHWGEFSYSELTRRCGASRSRVYEWRTGAKGASKLQLLRLVKMMSDIRPRQAEGEEKTLFDIWLAEVEEAHPEPAFANGLRSQSMRQPLSPSELAASRVAGRPNRSINF